jgi:hypothetical protein
MQAQGRSTCLSHVDATTYQSTARGPTADPVNPFIATNFSNLFWGCKQFADLYQRYRLTALHFQWVPSTAFTWSGTIAIKIVDDPLDALFVDNVNQFMNAPASIICPVNMPSAPTSWTPKNQPVAKYCYNTYTLDSQSFQFTEATGYSTINLMNYRDLSYGYLVFNPFGVLDGQGNAPDPATTIGRIIITAEMTYSQPIPIGQNRNSEVGIYPPKITAPPP